MMNESAGQGLGRRRRVIVGVALGGLSVSQAVIGGWALLAPARFYTGFPAADHPWVALLPPFNEHLVRDVGALSLALAALLAVAAIIGGRLLVRTGVASFALYAVPHTLFHALHLQNFAAGDAAAQMAGFALQLLLALVALLATFGGDSGKR